MRTKTQNGMTLEYPDKFAFMFNPCLFIVRSGAKKMEITLSDGNLQEYTLTFQAYGGAVYGDVRSTIQLYKTQQTFEVDYTQALYDTAKEIELSYEVVVTKTNNTTETFSALSTDFIWGALAPTGRDVFNGYRRRTWFTNFPFSFGVYSDTSSATILVRNDTIATTLPVTMYGMYAVTHDAFDPLANAIKVYDYAGTLQQATFDMTFDMTFLLQQNVPQTLLGDIITDDCTDGIYLRWINRHGFYDYYLFKVGTEQTKTTAETAFDRNNLLQWTELYGYQRGAGRRQAYKAENSVALCAPLVDADTFAYLQDVTTSPVVDMFVGADRDDDKWVGVCVTPATFSNTGKPLQDFAINLQLANTPLQRL